MAREGLIRMVQSMFQAGRFSILRSSRSSFSTGHLLRDVLMRVPGFIGIAARRMSSIGPPSGESGSSAVHTVFVYIPSERAYGRLSGPSIRTGHRVGRGVLRRFASGSAAGRDRFTDDAGIGGAARRPRRPAGRVALGPDAARAMQAKLQAVGNFRVLVFHR
jgi:hypothetical protein